MKLFKPAFMAACIAASGALVSCAAEPVATNACPPAITVLDPTGWQLGAGNYRARRSGDTISVTATGENSTAGYRVQLAQQPMKIYPPKFALYRKAPEGMAAQVITPFSVCVSFKAAPDFRVQFVTVRDSKGDQRVPVE